ncbi:uncharacterized protein LOC134236895 [Saccostrea cucullata]|uniref:uncharacterized protein LOC134236895 n=1 Tax=Saccostrea cuccullata TaxID=36930 RepID=UPI002ED0D08C
MEKSRTFQEAKHYFTDVWSPERKRVIVNLTHIKEIVQEQAKLYCMVSIVYSGIGALGGGLTLAGIVTAPSSLDVSLEFTEAGIATGVTSGASGLIYGCIKIEIVKKKCSDAKLCLENHNRTSAKMKDLIKILKNDSDNFEAKIKDNRDLEVSMTFQEMNRVGEAISVAKEIRNLIKHSHAVDVFSETGRSDKVARILGLGSLMDDLIPSALKDVSGGVVRLSMKVLGTFTIFGIVLDLISLVSNLWEIYGMEKGKLCKEAKRLNEILEVLMKEHEILSEYFE